MKRLEGGANGHTPPRGSAEGEAPDGAAEAPVTVEFRHRIRFTRDAFSPRNLVLREVLDTGPDSTGRAVAFIDDGVAREWPDLPERIRAYAAAHADLLKPIRAIEIVAGGERAKNDWDVYERVVRVINDAGICRQSFVLAIGGGAMLDAVGFAAATAHRGVRLVRFPTTTLGQCDAGIGVKNGINAFGKKNFIGAFQVPWAVINDDAFLATLDERDWRSGLSEAVKVAILKDAAFFDRISLAAPRLQPGEIALVRPVLERSAELHLDHIARGGDPFEHRSARPLDFGHWSAHKLEQMTSFRLRHGEAVAIGIAIDTMYSQLTGLCAQRDAERILRCLGDLGFALYDEALADRATLLQGLEEFREHLGGRMAITLLAGIGQPIDVHEIDRDRMMRAIDLLAGMASAQHAAKSPGHAP